MDLGEPIEIPSVRLPEPFNLPRPTLDIPQAEVPSYKPLVVPPSDLRPPPGVTGANKEETTKPAKNPDINYLKIPVIEKEVPMPSGEILMTAGTTAVVSVAATLTATQVFKWTVTALKPILKKAWTTITKKVSSSSSSSLSGQQDSSPPATPD